MAKNDFRAAYRAVRCAQADELLCDDLTWGMEWLAEICLCARNRVPLTLAERLELRRWQLDDAFWASADPFERPDDDRDEFPMGEFAPQCNVGPLYY